MTSRSPTMIICRGSTAAGLLALLLSCSSVAPPRFHTLLPAPATSTSQSAPAGTVPWEVMPVSIPAQVDQPQWVVRTVEGSLAVLEQERWIAPLAEEIRAAVADRLTQTLGATAAEIDPTKVWRVRIDVQRFDSNPGRDVRLEATWSVGSSAEAAKALRCRGEFVQPVSAAGYPSLATGHQRNVARLADSVSQSLKALSAGRAASCAS